MFRITARIAVPLAVAVAAGSPALASPVIIDDFNDGDDAGWTRWQIGASGEWDASSGAYRLSTTGIVSNGTTVGSAWDAGFDPAYADGYWGATVIRLNVTSRADISIRVTGNGYECYYMQWVADGSGRLNLFRIAADGSGVELDAFDGVAFNVGSAYIIELGGVGTRIEGRLWPVGGARPASPMVEADDATYAAGTVSLVGRVAGTGVLKVSYDDVYFDDAAVPCPADFNGDGVVNTLDFIDFLNAFNAGDPAADFTGDGIINTLDFIAFLNAFNAGC